MLFDYGDVRAEFVAPNGNDYDDLNDYSAVLLLTYNDKRFLFMGDAEGISEREILAAGHDITADVIKIGHHGSRSSSTCEFIEEVSPEHAVISVGKGNSYGHPSPEVIELLSSFNIEIHRTDIDSTIAAVCDGVNISLESFGNELQPRADEPPADTQAQSITVYVTETGTKYHAEDCRYLNNSKIPLDIEDARRSYTPCSVCKPPP